MLVAYVKKDHSVIQMLISESVRVSVCKKSWLHSSHCLQLQLPSCLREDELCVGVEREEEGIAKRVPPKTHIDIRRSTVLLAVPVVDWLVRQRPIGRKTFAIGCGWSNKVLD